MKKLVSIIAVLGLLTAAFPGCTSASTSNTPAANPAEGLSSSSGGEVDTDTQEVSVDIWVHNAWEESVNDRLASIDQQYPGIRPVVTAVMWNEYFTKLKVAASANNLPEVFMLDSTEIGYWDSLGKLKEIPDSIIQRVEGVYAANVLEMGMDFEGAYKALPVQAPVYNIWYYNADVFEQEGLELPKTWEDLRSLAEQLTTYDESGKVDRYALSVNAGSGQGSGWAWWAWIWQAGGDLVEADGATISFDNQAVRDTLEIARDLQPHNMVVTDSNIKISTLLNAGKVVMVESGFFDMENYMEVCTDIQLGILPWVLSKDAGSQPYAQASGWEIGMRNDATENAEKVLDYLICPEFDEIRSQAVSPPITAQVLENDPKYKGELWDTAFAVGQYARPFPTNKYVIQMQEILGDLVQSVQYGGDIEDGIADADKKVSYLFAEE